MEQQQQDLTGDGGVLKLVTKAGEEGAFPKPGDEIQAHYVGTLPTTGEVFDSSRKRNQVFKFVLGQGQVIKGWDVGFASMQRGEKATLTLKPEYAYGQAGSPPTIPANSTLVFECELVGFGPKKKEKWEMSGAEKLGEALALKDAGNAEFKQKHYAQALVKYEEALELIAEKSDENTKSEMESLGLTLMGNAAQAYLFEKEFAKCIRYCTLVLEADKTNLKIRLRRATAYVQFGMFPEAKQDLKELRESPELPTEMAQHVNKLVKQLHDAVEQQKQRDRQAFSGVFSKANLYAEMPFSGVVPLDKHVNTKRVFMDISIGSASAQRIEMELFCDTHPKTCENFLQLCQKREVGQGYIGSKFHRIIDNFMIQGGDFTAGNGTGGRSIYGEKFEDENLKGSNKHSEPFLLSMANAGPNTNGSQFFITTSEQPLTHLDGKHVVFGRVVTGQDVVKQMEQVEKLPGDKPKVDVVIQDCGAL